MSREELRGRYMAKTGDTGLLEIAAYADFLEESIMHGDYGIFDPKLAITVDKLQAENAQLRRKIEHLEELSNPKI